MSKEIKPCPFCGEKASVNFNPDGIKDTGGRKWAYTVSCNKCCASTGLCWSSDMAIQAWNNRVHVKANE